jgi:hypothetical protein
MPSRSSETASAPVPRAGLCRAGPTSAFTSCEARRRGGPPPIHSPQRRAPGTGGPASRGRRRRLHCSSSLLAGFPQTSHLDQLLGFMDRPSSRQATSKPDEICGTRPGGTPLVGRVQPASQEYMCRGRPISAAGRVGGGRRGGPRLMHGGSLRSPPGRKRQCPPFHLLQFHAGSPAGADLAPRPSSGRPASKPGPEAGAAGRPRLPSARSWTLPPDRYSMRPQGISCASGSRSQCSSQAQDWSHN